METVSASKCDHKLPWLGVGGYQEECRSWRSQASGSQCDLGRHPLLSGPYPAPGGSCVHRPVHSGMGWPKGGEGSWSLRKHPDTSHPQPLPWETTHESLRFLETAQTLRVELKDLSQLSTLRSTGQVLCWAPQVSQTRCWTGFSPYVVPDTQEVPCHHQ